MTGNEIRNLRTLAGLTPHQFAELVGASLSSVYRWESAGESAPRVDPFQFRVLVLLRQQLGINGTALARKIADGVTVGGGLMGLYRLLDDAFGSSDRLT